MGGGILAKLLRRADDSIYSGLGKVSSPAVMSQKAKQRMGNIDAAFKNQDLRKLAGKGNIKIRDAGGGGTTLLQEAYSMLTKR